MTTLSNVELTGAIWRAMDAGMDATAVRDAVDQAVSTHEPESADAESPEEAAA